MTNFRFVNKIVMNEAMTFLKYCIGGPLNTEIFAYLPRLPKYPL